LESKCTNQGANWCQHSVKARSCYQEGTCTGLCLHTPGIVLQTKLCIKPSIVFY
jgi:hypothetical protein